MCEKNDVDYVYKCFICEQFSKHPTTPNNKHSINKIYLLSSMAQYDFFVCSFGLVVMA